MIELKLPELGENIETAEVSRLLVSEGDTVKADQNVMELESEKASFPLPCPQAGKVAKILVKEGDTIKVGQTLLEIEEEEEAAPAKKEPSPKEKKAQPEAEKRELEEVSPEREEPRKRTAPEAPPKERPKEPPRKREAARVEKAPAEEKAGERDGRTKAAEEAAPQKEAAEAEKKHPTPAGPATRRLARELGVNLHEVKGSEPGGRITREDVKAYVQRRTTTSPKGLPPLPDFTRWGSVQRWRLNQIMRTTAERLSLAWRMVPHVTQHDVADITELEAAREEYNRNNQGSKPKITVTALIIQAAVGALKAYPQFNSSFDASAGELIVKEYFHIGVAVDTERGLLVPVIRDADCKSIVELAAELADLAEKARKGSLAAEEMEGGTFTITNLGGIGGTAFTPIVNYPEVAILGISKARQEQLVQNGQPSNRLLLPLSLSYDHRAVNGADGARFIGKVAELLSGTFKLLAEA